MKIDVAVQSYKKPESLIYTLLTLKKYSGDLIDKVYIDDDKSNDNSKDLLLSKQFSDAMAPIQIYYRENEKRGGYEADILTTEMFSKRTFKEKIYLLLGIICKRTIFVSTNDDIRYQWAINQTDKKWLLVIHDDVRFDSDIVSFFFQKYCDSNVAIAGEIGPCENCSFNQESKCNRERLIKGFRPRGYPVCGSRGILHNILGRKIRPCRVHEWVCLLNTDVAREVYLRYGICFGAASFGADVGGYIFKN